MATFKETWDRMAATARAGLIIGVVLIIALVAALGFWAYRTDYQVLFADLSTADAAAMTAELDKSKTPYQLTDNGQTILVPQELVYRTRLKLMGNELPLHGAVGFEVFNNADFGMTEFVQKVNYLRAIQGELTRTIQSIEQVQIARVHLALPEQGLFKKAHTTPKASVTLTMKNGKVLAPEQISGIQRLVAASVADIASADVTVLNQHGVALTRVAEADGGAAASASGNLDSKRGAEEYLLKKINQVLDRTYGAGEAVATVDVALNLDQSKVTTEEVIPAKNPDPTASAAGVVVRERSSAQDGAGGASGTATSKLAGTAGNSTAEFDYQVGRRVEQVVNATGTVKRMTVAVLVKPAMSADQLDKLKDVVAMAAGINTQRGDTVVVYAMNALATAPVLPAAAVTPADAAVADVAGTGATAAAPASNPVALILALLAAAAVAVIAVLLLTRRPVRGKRLSAAEREQLLRDVRLWIAAPAANDQGRQP